MGVIKQGILGGFQNKVGAVVGSSWKGIAVMKAKPISVANPRTAAQVANRTKMANIVLFAQVILATVIKPLWDRFASQMSGYNDFVKTNISQFATSMPDTPADLKISKGKMAATVMNSPTAANGSRTVTLNWTDDSGSGLKLASDVAFGVVVNVTQETVTGTFAARTRSQGSLAVTTPTNNSTSDQLECYLAFRRADGTVVSDSSHTQKIV
jgi:hypothetical protein